MTTNGNCTVYRKGFAEGERKYERFFIPKVMLQLKNAVSIKNSGMVDNSGLIRASIAFMPLSSLPDGFKPQNGDIIVPGDCSATTDEAGFLDAARIGYTVIAVFDRDFGGEDMRHVEVRCV